MARAKRTDRAEARRRWRQAGAAELEGAEVEELPATPSPASKTAAGSVQRPSITAAFRNAYRPARIREDIAVLPGLLRTRAFLVSILLVVGGTLAVTVVPGNVVTNLAFQALVVPPAMAPVFIVGFFARRASYILGFIVAVVDVLAYAFFVYAVAPGLAPATIDPIQQQQLILSAISVGPLSGIFFAAAAAWYRRFLTLSNAGAQNRARARQQQRARSGRPARG